MDYNLFLLIALCVSLIIILFLAERLWQVRKNLNIIKDALEDIKAGNLNRRVLARKNDMTKQICYLSLIHI